MPRIAWAIAAECRDIALLLVLTFGAVQSAAERSEIMIVLNDRGGYVGARALEIAQLNARETKVELRGRVCYSSCTMYLGADNLCISPQTTFGFHGPSRNGSSLPGRQFDHWSRVMAQHYAPPLRDWFMREARHRISGYYSISGDQLISMGYPAC